MRPTGNRFPNRRNRMESEMVKTESTTSFVSVSCGGEYCSMCDNPAVKKVGEEIAADDPMPIRHNLTAYVCAEHFNQIMHGSFRRRHAPAKPALKSAPGDEAVMVETMARAIQMSNRGFARKYLLASMVDCLKDAQAALSAIPIHAAVDVAYSLPIMTLGEKVRAAIAAYETALTASGHLRDVEALRAENACLREALADLVDVQQYAMGWDNGVTDSTGTINEGAYWQSLAMDRSRAALDAKP